MQYCLEIFFEDYSWSKINELPSLWISVVDKYCEFGPGRYFYFATEIPEYFKENPDMYDYGSEDYMHKTNSPESVELREWLNNNCKNWTYAYMINDKTPTQLSSGIMFIFETKNEMLLFKTTWYGNDR